ncbi:MAG: type II toxin-antitoxin system RelE/ParE family toxin [Terracidiphilus sp.]
MKNSNGKNIPLKTLGILGHNSSENWAVEFHEDFLQEFRQFSETVRRQVYSLIEVLKVFGPQLGRPHADTLKGSKHPNMKELRFRADDGAWRVAFAFDIAQKAILLAGGDKSGVSQDKFYRRLIATADGRFDRHQLAVAKEKKSNGNSI